MELLSYLPAAGWMLHSKLEGRANRTAKINSKNQVAGQLFRCNEEKWVEGEPPISYVRRIRNPNWQKSIKPLKVILLSCHILKLD